MGDYALMKQDDNIYYDVKEYIFNTESELNKLPVICAPGSTAFCIESGNVYMLSTQNTWTLIGDDLSVPIESEDDYSGVYVVTPQADTSTILNTKYKLMRDNVTVTAIPYYEVSNLGGGNTVIIG